MPPKGSSGLYVVAAILFAVVNTGMKCAADGSCLPARSADILVLDTLGIPETCRSGLSRARSSEPSDPTTGYCGVVATDYGPFGVRQNGWSLFGEEREGIVRSLVVGCRYSVVYYGGRYRFEDMVRPHSRFRNRGVPVVYSISGRGECDGTAQKS